MSVMKNSERREKTQLRITKLIEEINRHRELYHTLDAPEISDQAYDSLFKELETLEKEFPDLQTADSPTQKVGGVILKKFRKVTHRHPQWSFDDAFDFAGLQAWSERGKKILRKAGLTEIPSYVCELKIDGLKVILTYKKGVLVSGATRGDGVVGEDITENLLVVKSIPKKLTRPVDIIVVGEAWLRHDTFLRLNEERAKVGQAVFANPRNAAAGSLRQLDTRITKSRNLEVFFYEIDELVEGEKLQEIPTQEEVLKILEALGIPVNPHQGHAKNTEDIEVYYRQWITHKESVPYDLDGVVIKVNERPLQKALGYTGKAPRFGIAYKFPAEQATSVLESLHWQVGRTGALTPVATIMPTRIAGTVVSRATLHNYDEITRLDVRLGDTLIVQKAGDIIPEVVEVVTALRPSKAKKILEPKACPVCGSSVARRTTLDDETASLYCTNDNCPARVAAGLRHAVSRKALNIPGLGGKTGEQFLASGLVNDLGDLYLLTKEEILNLERFAEKSADNVIAAIKSAKQVPAERLLFAFGIRFIGEETANLLITYLQAMKGYEGEQKPLAFLEAFQSVSQQEWETIDGVGVRVAESITAWAHNPESKVVFKKLDKAGVQIMWPAVKEESKNIFLGETWVLTGELNNFTRDKATAIIKGNGGSVSGSVSKKTSFVLVGNDPGSKAKKADALGVPLVTEAQFQKRLSSI